MSIETVAETVACRYGATDIRTALATRRREIGRIQLVVATPRFSGGVGWVGRARLSKRRGGTGRTDRGHRRDGSVSSSGPAYYWLKGFTERLSALQQAPLTRRDGSKFQPDSPPM